MNSRIDVCLKTAAALCFFAALLHLGCIVFGGDWYRFLGAGEAMAQLAEKGHWYPTVITGIITGALMACALYALSAARVIKKLPLLRLALIVITTIFLVRGFGFILIMPMFPENGLFFWLISSAVCIVIGGLFATGLIGLLKNSRPLMGTNNDEKVSG